MKPSDIKFSVFENTCKYLIPLELIWNPKEDIMTYELAMCIPYLRSYSPIYEIDKTLPYLRHFEIIDHNVKNE